MTSRSGWRSVRVPGHVHPLLVLALLSGFTFAARVIPARPVVLPGSGEVRLLGTDAYFHLRHTRFAVEHFPRLQRWDPGAHYPRGRLP